MSYEADDDLMLSIRNITGITSKNFQDGGFKNKYLDWFLYPDVDNYNFIKEFLITISDLLKEAK